MKQREGDEALVATLWGRDFLTFENHYDLWISCRGCFIKGRRTPHHTSLFLSDWEKYKATEVFPKYLSDNGRSLLTYGRCLPCQDERAQRITRLIEERCMTPETAATVVDAAMFGIGCTEGRVRSIIQKQMEEKTK